MKVTMTTGEIYELYEYITEYLEKDIPLPKQAVWNLDENYEIITKIAKRLDKHRGDLIKPLTDKGAFEQTEDGNIKVKAEFVQEYMAADKEIGEYMETKNDIEVKTISKNSLPDNISFKDWKALKFMCVDDGSMPSQG